MVIQGMMPEESSAKDIQSWMDDFLTRVELQVSMDHEVRHQDGTVEEVKVGK